MDARKKQKRTRDTFLLLGIVFAVLGLVGSQTPFLILGVVLLVIGLVMLAQMRSRPTPTRVVGTRPARRRS